MRNRYFVSVTYCWMPSKVAQGTSTPAQLFGLSARGRVQIGREHGCAISTIPGFRIGEEALIEGVTAPRMPPQILVRQRSRVAAIN